jgi:uncharacterized protein HemY
MNPIFGRLLIITGMVLVIIGLLFLYLPKNFPIGRLPGDIYIKGKNFTVSFPVLTNILLSILVGVIFYFLERFFRK